MLDAGHDGPTQSCCCRQEHLSPREVEVLTLVATGKTNQAIAHRLHVSPDTVAHVLARSMAKVRAENRAELVSRAFVAGLLTVSQWPPASTGRRCLPEM